MKIQMHALSRINICAIDVLSYHPVQFAVFVIFRCLDLWCDHGRLSFFVLVLSNRGTVTPSKPSHSFAEQERRHPPVQAWHFIVVPERETKDDGQFSCFWSFSFSEQSSDWPNKFISRKTAATFSVALLAVVCPSALNSRRPLNDRSI